MSSFVAPDFSHRLFLLESVILGTEESGELVSLLVALAVNPSLEAVNAPLREKALALALQIDPVDRDARRALAALSRQLLPEDVNGEVTATVPEIAEKIAGMAEKLDVPDQSRDESALRAFLLAVAIEADAEGGERWKGKMLKAAGLAEIDGWQGAVKARPETNLLFGSEEAEVQSLPETSDAPAEPELDFSSLGFALSSASTHALSFRRFNSRGKRDTDLKMSGMTASLEGRSDEGSQSVLRLVGGLQGSAGRGFQPMRLMGFVRSVYPDWPKEAGVAVSFDNKDFGLPGRVAELPVVLAVLSLMGGDAPVSNVLPIGSVESDGRLAATTDFGDILMRLPDETASFFLVVPAEAETDLIDLAIQGRLELLVRRQTFIAGSVREAGELVSSSPDESLQRAILEFGRIQDELEGEKVKAQVLKGEKVYNGLQKVVSLAPNHASAAILLRTAEGNLPDVYSSRGALRVLGEIIRPWSEVAAAIETPADANLRDAQETNEQVVERLKALRKKLPARVIVFTDDMIALAEMAEEYITLRERGSDRRRQVRIKFLGQWQELKAEVERYATSLATTGRAAKSMP